MRFDPYKYVEVQPNEQITIKKGWLRLRSSQPGALFISVQGFEALAGVGTEFALQIEEAAEARLEASQGTRVFIEELPSTSYSTSEPVFTNIDRMPDESGSLLEVKKALRQLELQRRQTMLQIRQASEMLAMQKAAIAQPAATPAEPPAASSQGDEGATE